MSLENKFIDLYLKSQNKVKSIAAQIIRLVTKIKYKSMKFDKRLYEKVYQINTQKEI